MAGSMSDAMPPPSPFPQHPPTHQGQVVWQAQRPHILPRDEQQLIGPQLHCGVGGHLPQAHEGVVCG
jgi:hypothetical protein